MSETDIKYRIQKAAHDLMMQYSIRSVSMDDIASSLGISKKTIYQSFKDKDSLVDAVMSEILDVNRTRCMMMKGKAENAIHEIFLVLDMISDMFENMNPAVLYDMQKYHPSVFLKFLEFRNGFLMNLCCNNLERGRKEGLYRVDINIKVLCKYRIESMFIPFSSDFRNGLSESFTDLHEILIIHFLFGLVSEKGYELTKQYLKNHLQNNSLTNKNH